MKKNYMTQELSLSTELLEMALDFNELIDASSTPVWGIFGAFSVTPGRGGPMIAFETNGPSYSEEADETDPIAQRIPTPLSRRSETTSSTRWRSWQRS